MDFRFDCTLDKSSFLNYISFFFEPNTIQTMNLYLRLLWTLLRAWRMPHMNISQVLERQLRVLPNDLDINMHMNNGRYLTVIDLLLIEFFVRTGYAKVLLQQGWKPMSGGSIITYRRGLQPFQSYTVRYRFAACDEIWNYMHFEFIAGGKVCAAGYMKGAAVSKQGFVKNAQSYALLGIPLPTEALPEAVQLWQASERSLVDSFSIAKSTPRTADAQMP
jgi:acyl-CoA thioesterase FadM